MSHRCLHAALVLALIGARGLSPSRAEPGSEAWPREVILQGRGAMHGVLAPGDLVSKDPRIARVEGRGVVAVADGETEVTAGGAAVKVIVRDAGKPRSLDFPSAIVPILTRAGCNSSACHGAALGQGGFKLSLFGSEPEADHAAITHELAGRRIDRADQAMSLLLRKPSRQLPHRGGRVLPEEGEGYQTLLAWAEAGFPWRQEGLEVQGIEAHGEESILVRAMYSDGIARDVTRLALFSSNDDAIAEVDPRGMVTVKEAGETTVMVRFAGHVAAVRVGRPFAPSAHPALGAPPPATNAVDAIVNRSLERLGLEPSGDCGDAVFLRRAYLDLTGTLPSADEVRAFLRRPDREQLIDELLARPEFDAYWGYRFDQLLAVSSRRMGKEAAASFHAWLRGRVRLPWAETARAILIASGSAPETGFYRLASDPKELAEQAGRVFLGARWQCAQCHDHPFERFRQRDYYGLAAMFVRVWNTDEGIVHMDRGELRHAKTEKDVLPVFPDGTPGDAIGDRRLQFADWVISQAQFRHAFANRIWALLMGRGLVEPADDFRASNPPSHPELLEELSRLETLPEIARAIVRSGAYQRAGPTAANRADDRAGSHAAIKPLAAEVLVDAIARAAGSEEAYGERPPGTRAVDLGDSAYPSYTLDVCGRNRAAFDGSLAMELHLLAGSAVQSKLAGVQRLLLRDDADLVEELYLRSLSRPPSGVESRHWTAMLATGPRSEVAEDLLWALLNSREFTTCH